MKKTLLTVAAAAVSVTCLAWAQPPQGAKETVVIKEESAAAKKPKETLPTPGAAPKPKVARDPFVKGGEAPPPPPPLSDNKDPKPDPNKPPEIKGPDAKPAPVIAAPDVAVKGILLGPRGNRAIVTGPTMTFIVKQGDKLGDYKVAHIDRKSVVFTFKSKKFPVKLEDEFSAAKK